jgi:hypothetical protein
LDDFLICLGEGELMQVLVQVGDVLDRGEDEIAILSLLAWLGKQARSKGGAVFQVLFSCFFSSQRSSHLVTKGNFLQVYNIALKKCSCVV